MYVSALSPEVSAAVRARKAAHSLFVKDSYDVTCAYRALFHRSPDVIRTHAGASLLTREGWTA